MDVFEAVKTVLAVRAFQEKPIPQDIVNEIVQSAWLSASASNLQPWHFILVQDRNTLKQLGSLARTGPYIAQAPLAIVVVNDASSKFAESDSSRAIQNMILTAWSHGVGSNWVGFHGLDQVKPVLNIPNNQDILAIIPFGYPAKQVGKGKKNRKPLGEVVYKERWGQGYK